MSVLVYALAVVGAVGILCAVTLWWLTRRPLDQRDSVSQTWCNEHGRDAGTKGK